MRPISSVFLAGFAIFAPLLTACGKETSVTPKGTVVVDWDISKATRVPFRSAKVGAHTSKDYKVTITNGEVPFDVTVHVESAPVEYKEGSGEVRDVAPVVVRVTVADNDAWNVTGKCEEGPNYNMPSGYADGGFVNVPGIIQSCTIHYDRTGGFLRGSSWQLLTTINVESAKPITLFPQEYGTVKSM